MAKKAKKTKLADRPVSKPQPKDFVLQRGVIATNSGRIVSAGGKIMAGELTEERLKVLQEKNAIAPLTTEKKAIIKK